MYTFFFFFSSRRRHTRLQGDWSSDVCSSDLEPQRAGAVRERLEAGDPEELGKQHANELLDAPVAFAPIFEGDADKRPVDAAGESADDREIALDLGDLPDDLLDLAHVAVRVFERGALGPEAHHQE